DDIGEVLRRVAESSTRVVTLTVTEKGYRHDPASGQLRRDDDTMADAAGRPPQTVVGQLVRAFQLRCARGNGPLTVVCCDNLPNNGATLRSLVHEFCDLLPSAEARLLRNW